jgi:hypothetical protein
VTDPAILHYSPSPVELQDSRAWFSSHCNEIIGVETKFPLIFLSSTGSGCLLGYNMFSFDQGDVTKAADEVGQVWICDCLFWNRLMGGVTPFNPSQRIQFLTSLVKYYNTPLADAVIQCYVERNTDHEANKHLLQFGIQRNFDVAKSSVIYHNQKAGSIERLGYSNRDWEKPEMEEAWRKMCSLCLTTGIHDRVLDITWNRFTDDLRHNEADCISNLVRLNDAIHSHKAFHSQENIREYCEEHGISMNQHRIIIFNTIVRPIIEQIIRVQARKFHLPLPACLE